MGLRRTESIFSSSLMRLLSSLISSVKSFFTVGEYPFGLKRTSLQVSRTADIFLFWLHRFFFGLEETAEMIEEATDVDGPAKNIYDMIESWCSCVFFYFYYY